MYKVLKINEGREAILINTDTNLPVREVIDYTSFLKKSGKASNTRINYVKQLKKLYDFSLVKGLSVLDVFDGKHDPYDFFGDYMVYLESEGSSKENPKNNTINYALNIAYQFCDYLAARGLIEKGPTQIFPASYKSQTHGFMKGLSKKSVKSIESMMYLPHDPANPNEYINWDQYVALIKACNNTRDKVLTGLQFENGLRVSEALGIHIEDLHLERGEIFIKYREDNENHAYVKRRAEGTIKLSEWMCEWVLLLLAEMSNIDTEYLFVVMCGKTTGRALNYTNTVDLYKRLSKKTGIKYHNHMLRHGWGQTREMDGWDMSEIARGLRHSSTASAERYAAPDKEALDRKTADFLDGVIDKWED